MLRSPALSLKNAVMTSTLPQKPLLVILGATGTGKSQLAIDLALRYNGEIINGDAMQMYDGLPIITNKVTDQEKNEIPHHLLGCVGLDEKPWHTGLFRNKASIVIQEIRSRGRIPILVGGTHYYTQSLLFEDSLIYENGGVDEDAEDGSSEHEIQKQFPVLAGPTDEMLEQLTEVDPIMAQRWHPKDRRKIQRSLEIYLRTGKRASELYEEQKKAKLARKNQTKAEEKNPADVDTGLSSTLLFWVYSEPETLKARLDSRVDKMIAAGMLDEVKELNQFLKDQTAKGLDVDKTRGIWVSIGWKEFEQYYAAIGSTSTSNEELMKRFNEAVDQVKASTRQYATRQVRWIRHKLIPALADEEAFNNLYLVDGSDVSKWEKAVSQPAIEITRQFLEGSGRVSPNELSETAKAVLSSVDPKDERRAFAKQECDLCHVTAVNEQQWQLHLKGRRHKALTRRKKNLEMGNFANGLPGAETGKSIEDP